ncbi:MAG: hypothetical protein F4X07_06155 [Acidimicrobiaceae bacterium]|nr:hypothetical protein [Acidimicrobiaceae bacterium]
MSVVEADAGVGVHGTGARKPPAARTYVVVGEIPAALATSRGRGAGYGPLVQFIKDWNNCPESREFMLAGGLPEGTDTVAAAKIAAVVHALCQRDRHPLPTWVLSARSPVEVALVPVVDLESPYGQRLRDNAPGVCHFYRVYFSVVDLQST